MYLAVVHSTGVSHVFQTSLLTQRPELCAMLIWRFMSGPEWWPCGLKVKWLRVAGFSLLISGMTTPTLKYFQKSMQKSFNTYESWENNLFPLYNWSPDDIQHCCGILIILPGRCPKKDCKALIATSEEFSLSFQSFTSSSWSFNSHKVVVPQHQ